MRKVLAAALFGVGLSLAGSAWAVPMTFTATLGGGQEVPPVASAASGSATLELNAAMDRLSMTITLSGLDLDGNQTVSPNDDVVGLHIHRAPVGNNGPVVFGLISPNNDLNGDLVINAVAGTLFSAWDLNEGNGTTLAAELGNLLAGGLYFNVHTAANPSGEIRGQISRMVTEPTTIALMAVGLFGVGYSRRRRPQ